MKRTGYFLAATAALTLALAPGLAEARVGGSTSSGSRGSNTYSAPPSTNTAPGTAQPMQRSMTQPAPSAAPHAPAAAAPMQPRSSFMSGMMGGLIGVGIGGLLFGHGFMGGGLGGIGFLGLLLQIGLVVGLGWLLVRLFMGARRPTPAMAGGPAMFTPDAQPSQRPMQGGGGGVSPMGGLTPVAITAPDYQAFEQILKGAQAAWSTQDLNAMRAVATPEMISYFTEQLSELSSRGQRNQVTDVRLESGDLAEAWAEQGREYATVAMRFSMIDCTYDQAGRVVDGNPTQRTMATEIWTFVRSRGGNWILSAIQQSR